MKIAKKSLITVVVTASVALFAGIAEAATIKFKTIGGDSGSNAARRDNFFRVIFEEGPENVYIDQLILDLSADPDASFNFSRPRRAPQVGNNSDVTDAEFSYSLDGQQLLTLDFADGAFTTGETLMFGMNTNNVGPGFFDPGGDFGLAGVTFDVTLSNGTFGTGTFERQSRRRSVAVANILDPEPVPESSTVLGLFAILGMSGFSLKRLNQ
ncbi:PEP-CTERM sorting domain-containing protein [Okeania sp.]|uniref:PEP-CTERM sorting domain-containing protein n=1 Tax=Okeania sp. TaxID=3100323 RepID=UPI002B4B75FF|nr:PEP-CTERM sorting domain-containing protein [Okeania sp.]MEB3341645.1 PEP-CTERM sorting domain-containing protein [Okeania sp.]